MRSAAVMIVPYEHGRSAVCPPCRPDTSIDDTSALDRQRPDPSGDEEVRFDRAHPGVDDGGTKIAPVWPARSSEPSTSPTLGATMHILGLCGSLRSGSLNHRLLEVAGRSLPDGEIGRAHV